MCEFISLKEVRCPDGSTQILFLTYDDIYNTSRGLELRNHTTGDDLVGHGAIDFYYQLNGRGVNKEYTDFSSPDNFPAEVVQAIKSGKFYLLGMAKELLTNPAWAKYVKIRQSAWAKFVKIGQSAFWDLFSIIENRAEAWR